MLPYLPTSLDPMPTLKAQDRIHAEHLARASLPPHPMDAPRGHIRVETWSMMELLRQTSPNLCQLWGLIR